MITRYADLLKTLEALPPVAPGHVRIYRGQTADYPTLTPTGLRNTPKARDEVWPLYATLLAQDVAQLRSDPDYVGEDLYLFIFWAQAIKQHYGPGTDFLDVTRSPAIAAWFALHRYEPVEVTAAYGAPGAFDPERDTLAIHSFARYRPHAEAPGYIYVLDVPRPDATPDLGHGSLIDLSLAPKAFSESPRIRAQEACLLHATRESSDGDLRSFVVGGTPIAIGWPLEGCKEVQWPTERVFPGARIDDWYARFVALPLVPALGPKADVTRFGHPMQVSLYMPDRSPDDFEDLRQRMISLPPPLVFPTMAAEVRNDPERSHDPIWARLSEATRILMEGPVLYATPPIDSGFWNLGLLAGDLTPAAPLYDFVSGKIIGEGSLENVFFEFSPLENAGWERFEQPGNELSLTRGIWLLRDGLDWLATLVIQDLPGGPVATAGPVRIRYDRASGFTMSPSARDTFRPLAAMPIIARPFVKALSLVRDLSPRWKLAATTALQTDAGSAHQSFIVPVHHALGDLMSLRDLGGVIAQYCVLRRHQGAQLFFGGAPASEAAGGLRISGPVPFSSMDADQLRTDARAVIARLEAGN